MFTDLADIPAMFQAYVVWVPAAGAMRVFTPLDIGRERELDEASDKKVQLAHSRKQWAARKAASKALRKQARLDALSDRA